MDARGGSGGDRDELPTLRVTNLSEDADENEVRDLFSNYGNVNRCFLVKDRETGRSKGFAFISFYERAHAEKAMKELHGYGYENLILRIDWADKRKPL